MCSYAPMTGGIKIKGEYVCRIPNIRILSHPAFFEKWEVGWDNILFKKTRAPHVVLPPEKYPYYIEG